MANRRVAVWGRGPASSPVIRAGEATEAAIFTAARYGFRLRSPEDWAVEVEADAADVDAATRHDPAVLGYVPLLTLPAPEVVAMARRALDAIGRHARIEYRAAGRVLHATTVVVGVELRQGERGAYRLRLVVWDPDDDPRARTWIDDPTEIEIVE